MYVVVFWFCGYVVVFGEVGFVGVEYVDGVFDFVGFCFSKLVEDVFLEFVFVLVCC